MVVPSVDEVTLMDFSSTLASQSSMLPRPLVAFCQSVWTSSSWASFRSLMTRLTTWLLWISSVWLASMLRMVSRVGAAMPDTWSTVLAST